MPNKWPLTISLFAQYPNPNPNPDHKSYSAIFILQNATLLFQKRSQTNYVFCQVKQCLQTSSRVSPYILAPIMKMMTTGICHTP